MSRGNISFAPRDISSHLLIIYIANTTSRRWFFTFNNPDHVITESDCVSWGATYVVYQEEMGESGTHHLQGYIEVKSPCRTSKFKGLEGAFFIKPNGTPQQNHDYCTKEETRLSPPFVWGTISKGQGSRSDVLLLRDAVKSGKRGRDLYDDDSVAGAAIKFGRAVNDLTRAYAVAPSREDIRVIFHFGPAGTGKTHCCHSDDGMICYLGGFFCF